MQMHNINEHNIVNSFNYFTKCVIDKSYNSWPSIIIVSTFFGILTDVNDNYYIHPDNNNFICTPYGQIQVNYSQYNEFIKQYKREYSQDEKLKITEIIDRLIEDIDRKNKGAFYTPAIFVNYAHKMISDVLGNNWKDEFIVWDNCCGTKNLTRDYKFKELYCSTLELAELDISVRYNPEATSFQFDFLNDDLDKLPKGLLDAFKQNKKILFFLNPPYGTPTGSSGVGVGCSKSSLKSNMHNDGINGNEFIIQFLYRLCKIKQKYNLTNCYLAYFTNPSWLIKPHAYNFRKLFLDNFNYVNGCLFQASEFGNVSNLWGITFNIWKSEKAEQINNFDHIVIKNDGYINELSHKIIYNLDDLETISTVDYIKRNIQGDKSEKSILYAKNVSKMVFEYGQAQVYDKYIATITCAGNDVQQNKLTSIRNIYPKSGGGIMQITQDNFKDCCLVFAIKKLVSTNWINAKDLYIINKNAIIPDEFQNDAIVFSIFSTANQCCSIYQEDNRLNNEFFWMSKVELNLLANEHNNKSFQYSDLITSEERFVYKVLQTITLSSEAQVVLDKASEIVKETFKYREIFYIYHPEVQINNWDAGFYQIRRLCQEFAPDLLKEFNKVYKALQDKMKPIVYELGLLNK